MFSFITENTQESLTV